MGPRGWAGVAIAAIGLLAASVSALPLILDEGQEWSGPVAGIGFALAFVGLVVGATDSGRPRRRT